jgi:hypothetical protein
VGVTSVFHFALGMGGRGGACFLLGGKLDVGDGRGCEVHSGVSLGCSLSALFSFFSSCPVPGKEVVGAYL